MSGLTITDGAKAMTPPMPRRELARRLKDAAPVGTQYGRRGARARLYAVADIMKAHAEWMRGRTAVGEGSSGVPQFRHLNRAQMRSGGDQDG